MNEQFKLVSSEFKIVRTESMNVSAKENVRLTRQISPHYFMSTVICI